MTTDLLLDRYEVLETIGRGGSSEIVKALDRRMERIVAVKVIPATEKTALRALREARTVALLNHPNIVTVYEFEETADNYYLIMEYLEGVTLEEYAAGQVPLGTELATAIAIQVCQGLENAHLNDVIHRDIKPANLMLLADGRVKVMDFGVSRLKWTPVTRDGSITGTFAYMSPEQAAGELVDERSDVWSLGVVLYEMLTGANPFAADTPAAAVLKILNNDPAKPADLNPAVGAELSQVIMKALDKFPEKRFDLATDFRYKLERYRGSKRSPRSIVRDAVGDATPKPAVNPNYQPVTYLRSRLADTVERYGQVTARLVSFTMLSASVVWFASGYAGPSASQLSAIAAAIFIVGAVFPQLGLILTGLLLAGIISTKTIPGAAGFIVFYLAYWFLLGRRRPQAAALTLAAPATAALGLPFLLPLGIGLILTVDSAPIFAAVGLIISVAAETALGINFSLPLAQTTGSPVLRLLGASTIWQAGAWALAALVGALLSRNRALVSKVAALVASSAVILLSYQLAPGDLGLFQAISPRVMQPLTFSFIIALVLLLLFHHRSEAGREHHRERGQIKKRINTRQRAVSDNLSRDRKKARRPV